MKRLFLSLCLPLGFGCSSMLTADNEKTYSDEPQLVSAQREVAAPQTSTSVFQSNQVVMNDSTFTAAPTRKNINHYVRGIMQDMVENLQYVNV